MVKTQRGNRSGRKSSPGCKRGVLQTGSRAPKPGSLGRFTREGGLGSDGVKRGKVVMREGTVGTASESSEGRFSSFLSMLQSRDVTFHGRFISNKHNRDLVSLADVQVQFAVLGRGFSFASERNSQSEVHESKAKMDFVKVVLLGGAGVGKTSIVQRFVRNEFSEKYSPTEQKETYYPSVIINDHLYELKISDIPVISYFPVNSYYEWADFRFYGLRSATAYILVFDLSNVETFQFIRTMREQMMESRDMKHVPLLIVGNKQDLIAADSSSGSGLAPPSGNSLSNHLDHNQRKRRDIVNLVKKHWKCNYVECSAKHNWGVIAVFKELMEVIDSMDPNKNHNREVYSSPMIDNIHDAFDGNKCVIL